MKYIDPHPLRQPNTDDTFTCPFRRGRRFGAAFWRVRPFQRQCFHDYFKHLTEVSPSARRGME